MFCLFVSCTSGYGAFTVCFEYENALPGFSKFEELFNPRPI